MYASNTIGTVVVSSTQSVIVDYPTLPLKVSCPTVAAPDIPYRRFIFALIQKRLDIALNLQHQANKGQENMRAIFTPNMQCLSD